MIKSFTYSFFVLFFMLLNNQLYSVNYLIDGYVVIENLYLPVENQIVEIRNADGEIIASALTDEAGYYSKEIDLPVSAGIVTLSLSRICSGEVNYYNHTLQLENVHLGYTFLVCEDQICEAGFNYEQQSRNSLVIEFTNISEGDIDSYFWNFGDGSTSTEANPVHEYAGQEDYIVSLTVNGQNCTDAVAREVGVFFRDCLSKFSFNQVNQGQQLVVEFKNESQGNNLQYLWHFGSSGSSYEANPSYAFPAPGNYLVTLNVASKGCFHSLTKIVEVAPLQGCFALFNSSQMFSPSLEMQFTDLSVGNEILYHVWQFGDGNSSTEPNPQHVYEQPGNYEVSLRVISAQCQSFYTRNTPVIQSSGCIADFDYTQPDPDNPQLVFNSLTANENLQFSWDFGDGDTSNQKSPAHQYDDFGIYEVSLNVLGYGCTDDKTELVMIEEPVYCESKFIYQQAFPQSREIDFLNQSFGDDLEYLWKFGDGETSDEENPTHSYPGPGDYQAKLIVSNPQNCMDSSFANIQILPPLSVSGIVYAGNAPLTMGSVFLYGLTAGEQLRLVEKAALDAGYFAFEDILPGAYFVQAVPEFDFPFPTIPFYFPVYSGGVVCWQDAGIIQADNPPEDVIIYLGSYNDFFDGKATIEGTVNQTTGDELPLVIYLCNEFDQVFQFRQPDDELDFSFKNIPYGNYKVRPEKPGKTSEAYEVTLDETFPEMINLVFLETQTSIVPDLSLVGEGKTGNRLSIYPNPATGHFFLSQSGKPMRVNIYSPVSMELLLSEHVSGQRAIHLDGFSSGLFLVEIFDGTAFHYQKLLVRH